MEPLGPPTPPPAAPGLAGSNPSLLVAHRAGGPRRLRPAAALLLILATLSACAPEPEGPPVRVVLVTIDTLRKDAFDELMPLTATYAARGQVFERFFSATSTTQPSHVSMFTGLHPWQHGVTRNGQILDDDVPSLPEILDDAGFDTAAVVASFPLHDTFDWDRGFDDFDDEFTRVHLQLQDTWEDQKIEDRKFYSLGEHVTDRALELLEDADGHRQFFWFHYFDAHDPYGDATGEAAPTQIGLSTVLATLQTEGYDADKTTGRAREFYDVDVAALDTALDRLWRGLMTDGAIETHVVVATDHGESFGEAGSVGHGKRLTHEQVHVPAFIVSPRLAPGRRQDVSGSVDIAPTVLSLAGLDPTGLGGRDLSRSVGPDEGVAFGMRRTFVDPFHEVRTDGTEAIHHAPAFYAVRQGEILAGDGDEIREGDLDEALLDDEAAAPFRALFSSFAAELDGRAGQEVTDAETQDALRALGYVR